MIADEYFYLYIRKYKNALLIRLFCLFSDIKSNLFLNLKKQFRLKYSENMMKLINNQDHIKKCGLKVFLLSNG